MVIHLVLGAVLRASDHLPIEGHCPQSQFRNGFLRQLQFAIRNLQSHLSAGVLAQLVERLNGIEEVTGSNPVGSTPF